ncbi:MAG TPA: hypothetical protein VHR66_24585 [Gemmataceae bacterium]|jgi:hypothetical protein|nr:hypothetical protein [Gemmataceae bacterium]
MIRPCPLLLLLPTLASAAPPERYSPKVAVSAPTRIDWVFTVATQSPAEPPAKFLSKDFDSAKHADRVLFLR